MSLILSLLVLSYFAKAQMIRGVVTDERSKEPIVNASVSISRNGVSKGGGITDFDGKYSIRVDDTGMYVVTVTYVGYNNRTVVQVPASDTTKLDMAMVPRTDIKFYNEITYCSRCRPLLDRYATKFTIHPWQIKGSNR